MEKYRILFCEGLNFSNALKLIEEKIKDSPEKDEILLFLSSSHAGRGIIKGNAELAEPIINGHSH
jgi:acyl-[acyl carrier protein]--UDP-N-acetylglucosamine O-acyltransferase